MYKLKLKKRESFVPINCSRWLCAVAVSVLLASCGAGSGDGDGGNDNNPSGNGGIIGTGIYLEGTASSQTQFASNDIEVKSSTGEKSTTSIGNRGRFQLDKVAGTGPVLMRATTGENEYLYSIGYPQADGKLAQNIHSYTDAAARNWFASKGLDIDSTFLGETPINQLPPQATLQTISNRLQSIVSGALAEYNLPNTNLDNISFEADDTGVDLFLDSNPVVINNGTINIQILDQASQLVTPSSADVSLDTDLTMDDQLPPSTPDSVRALSASPNEMVVVWNASTDNIGVKEYQVFRDSTLVATTPFPVYTDAGLTANTQYSYTVVAVDSSDLKSAESITAMSETLGTPDNTAPPTPLLVMLEPSLGSIKVSWSQNEIFDVKAFNIYRNSDAMPTFKVTSDFITDVNVQSGSEFCYEISAEDASGNESGRTAVQCVTAPGASVAPTPTTPPVVTTPDPVTPSTGLLAPTLDVTGIACTDEVPDNGTFSTDTVLTAGCYLAPNGITIQEPANLTVEPGVVVKFGASTYIWVRSGASMTAVGTQAAPIVFSAIDPTPGYWTGVNYYFTNSSRNQLDFVQVEYAGSNESGSNLEIESNASSPTRLSIKNSTFRNGLGFGIDIQRNAIISAFEGNLLVDNNAPLSLSTDTANAISANSQFSGNRIDEVRLTSIDVATATRLAKLDAPYSAGGFTIDNSLTIEPGVEIRFDGGSKLWVDEAGSIKAIGTTAEPIRLTGKDQFPGSWEGIDFFYSASPVNQLSHVTVEYAGGGTSDPNDTGNIILQCNPSNPTRLSIDNVKLDFGLGWGMHGSTSGCVVNIGENVTYSGNAAGGFNLMP